MKETKHNDAKEKIIEFIRFCLVGASNTVVYYVFYNLFLLLFERIHFLGTYGYIGASVIAFIISVAWSYYWNARFTFKSKEGKWRLEIKGFVKSLCGYSLSGLILHNALLFVFISKIGLSKYVAPLICSLITVPLNFLFNRVFVFNIKKRNMS